MRLEPMQHRDPTFSCSDLARRSRQLIVEMVSSAGSGHIDSSFSCVDILSALYWGHLRVDPQRPDDPRRDRLVLSKGHAAPALYAILALQGFFEIKDLQTLRTLDSPLQGHPRVGLPGIDASSGSLGQGLSVAAGMALGIAAQGINARVFAVLSDGELNEGQSWEAFMSVGRMQVSNLIAIVDRNGLQYTGRTSQFARLDQLDVILSKLGWTVRTVDGHDHKALLRCFDAGDTGGPLLVIADTVKGRGVSFMEDDITWHGRAPSVIEARAALAELGSSEDLNA